MQLARVTIFLLFITLSIPSSGILKFDVSAGKMGTIRLAITAFPRNKFEQDVIGIIKHDLESTEIFKFVTNDAFLEKLEFTQTPTFRYWRRLNMSLIVLVKSSKISNTVHEVLVKIWDPYSGKKALERRYVTQKKGIRSIGHRISDSVYELLTCDTGYFNSKIVFISERGEWSRREKRLTIMDSDGHSKLFLTSGQYIVLTPSYDHHTQRVLFTSYKYTKPRVYLLDFSTGIKKFIGIYEGMSFSPRFSPCGTRAAISIAKDGSTSLHELHLRTGELKQLTKIRRKICTAPSYSPDGKKLVFSSDKDGISNLYTLDLKNNKIKKLSKGRGAYGSPTWSPRGDYIAFTKVYKGKFYIGILRSDGSGERLLTTSWLDESPTWSPNGKIIMFTRQEIKGGKIKLYIVDITGHNIREVETDEDASDPTWSSLLE